MNSTRISENGSLSNNIKFIWRYMMWSGSRSRDLTYELSVMSVNLGEGYGAYLFSFTRPSRFPTASIERGQCATATRRDFVCVFQFQYCVFIVIKTKETLKSSIPFAKLIIFRLSNLCKNCKKLSIQTICERIRK